jgi:hypothetical protein
MSVVDIVKNHARVWAQGKGLPEGVRIIPQGRIKQSEGWKVAIFTPTCPGNACARIALLEVSTEGVAKVLRERVPAVHTEIPQNMLQDGEKKFSIVHRFLDMLDNADQDNGLIPDWCIYWEEPNRGARGSRKMYKHVDVVFAFEYEGVECNMCVQVFGSHSAKQNFFKGGGTRANKICPVVLWRTATAQEVLPAFFDAVMKRMKNGWVASQLR